MKNNENDAKNNFFKFEKNGLDFPLYKDNPHISLKKWAFLAITVIIPMILIFIPFSLGGRVAGLLYFLIPFLGFGLVVNWKYDLICKKFQRGDFKLIVGIIVLEYIFTFLVAIILLFLLHLNIQANPAGGQLHSILFWIVYPFQIFGEELIKIIPFLIFMFLIYKFTENRKLSIVVSTILVLLIFGLLHLPAYKNIISVLLLQGLGSVFTMFGYLKTKNIFVSYLAHVIFDLISFLAGMGKFI